MGAWGPGPLQSDAAYELIGEASNRVLGRLEAAVEAGDAATARGALDLLRVMQGRLPGVPLPDDEADDGGLGTLEARVGALGVVPGNTVVAAETHAWLLAELEKEFAEDDEGDVLAILTILAMLGPDVVGFSQPDAAHVDVWEQRYWAFDLSEWRDPEERAGEAREVFAALRDRRLPDLDSTGLLDSVAAYLLFGGQGNASSRDEPLD